MSLNRVAVASASTFIRYSQPTPSGLSQICPRCLYRANIRPPQCYDLRRSFVSAAAYRPQTLDPQPAPRSSQIADVSRTSKNALESSAASAQSPKQAGIASQAVAVGSVARQDQATTDKKPRRRTLKPRKAALTLTSAAVEQLRELLRQPEPKMIRVGVKNRGCSGLAYHLEYVEKPGTFDEAVDQDGVKVLIDSKALFSIIGSEMDWVEDKLNRKFVFRNPNITEQCGCGESFSIS